MTEICAGCGKPIEMNQPSYYRKLGDNSDIGQSFHAGCGDPFGLTRLPDSKILAMAEAYEAERILWGVRTNKWVGVYEVIRCPSDGDPEVRASASTNEGAMDSMDIRRKHAAMRAALAALDQR
jgi:hypothetical protein